MPRDRNKKCERCGEEFTDKSPANNKVICYKQECFDAKYPTAKPKEDVKGEPVKDIFQTAAAERKEAPTRDTIQVELDLDYDRLAAAIVENLYSRLTTKHIVLKLQ